jgi:hypothetical protein
VVAGGLAWVFAWGLRRAVLQLPSVHWLHHTRLTDAAILVAGTLLWAFITKVILDKTGSALPRVAMKKLRLA